MTKSITIKEVQENVSKGKGTDFSKDLKEAISNRLGINHNQATIIYDQAWYNGHSNGLNAVVQITEDMVTLFEAVNDAKY